MLNGSSGVSLGARLLFAAPFVLGAILAPAAAQAQADQKIVMRCTYDGYTNQTLDYVIDLAAKTVSLTYTLQTSGSPNVQTIAPTLTQVTDDKIAWDYSWPSDPTRRHAEILDRYTGRIVEQVISPDSNFTVLISCQRQQKQF